MSLIVFGLLVVYIGGAWKFWKGYNRTQFNRTMSDKIRLSLLWPGLFALEPSYRKNFRKALKG